MPDRLLTGSRRYKQRFSQGCYRMPGRLLTDSVRFPTTLLAGQLIACQAWLLVGRGGVSQQRFTHPASHMPDR
eukprot:12889819-Prorocentrum_lima.AAC.1